MQRPMPFHLDTNPQEDAILRRLGAAYILQYHAIPKAARDLIEDQAGCIADGSLMRKPRQEIAAMIARHAPPQRASLRKKSVTPKNNH